MEFTPEELDIEKKVREERERLRRAFQGRPAYLIPKTRFAKSEQSLKLISLGKGMGVQIPTDVVFAMGLKKGMLLKITLELFPSDAHALFQD